MALTKATFDTDNIASLSETPSSTEGLTALQLQQLFDQIGVDIKTYLNYTLTEEVDDLSEDITTLSDNVDALTNDVDNLKTVDCLGCYMNSNQSLPSATSTTVILNSIEFNKNISLNTTTGEITVSKSGLYNISYNLRLVGGSLTTHRFFANLVFTNAGPYCLSTIRSMDTQQVANDTTISFSTTVFLLKDASFKLTTYSDLADTIKGTSNYNASPSTLNIFKVGEYFNA